MSPRPVLWLPSVLLVQRFLHTTFFCFNWSRYGAVVYFDPMVCYQRGCDPECRPVYGVEDVVLPEVSWLM